MDGCVPVPRHVRPITFEKLLQELSSPEAINKERNLAFVNGIRRHCRRSASDDAASDMFDDQVVTSYLAEAGATPNRRSALAHIRNVLNGLPPETLGDILDRVMDAWISRGGSRKSLLLQAGMHDVSLRGYMTKSQTPTETHRASLEKIEVLGGLKPGCLTCFISTWGKANFKFRTQYFDLANPFYFWDQKKRRHLYAFQPRLLAQAADYFDHKIDEFGNHKVALPDGTFRKSNRNEAWTKSAMAVRVPWRAFPRWKFYPSVFINLGFFRSIAELARQRHAGNADTLAILLDVDTVEQWLTDDVRLRGTFHTGHEVMIASLAALLHPEHGYMFQLPEIFLPDARRLGLDVDEERWQSFVAEQYARIRALPKKLVPNRPRGERKKRSRDKKRKLKAILDHEDAYTAFVFPTLLAMQDERPPHFAPEFVKLEFEVQLLTFALFAACPLRLMNWSLAEWGKHLRRGAASEWWVEIPAAEQKNRRVLDRDLRILLPQWAAAIVEHYYVHVRARVATFNPIASSRVMAGPKIWARIKKAYEEAVDPETAKDVAAEHVYTTASHRIALMTKAMWNVRVSAHDWRDIYATDFLNKHPGDVLTVAMILNDTPETVMREYARPDSARLSRRAARLLDEEYDAVVAARTRARDASRRAKERS